MAAKFLINMDDVSFHKEFLPLTYLLHENIVRVFGWIEDLNIKGIVMEFMQGGSLSKGKYCFQVIQIL